MTESLPAATYARQSIDHAEGAADQIRRAIRLIEDEGYPVVGSYRDNETSAVKERGEGTDWARLLGDIGAGRVRVVAVTDVDRLVRDVVEAATLCKLDPAPVILTLDNTYDLGTASGERAFLQEATGARFEVRRKRERALRGNERRAAAGAYKNGPRPFGYADDRRAVHPVEGPLLREAYRRVAEGSSVYSIVRDWNERGIATHSATLAAEAKARAVFDGLTEEARTNLQERLQVRASSAAPRWTHAAVRALLGRERNCGRVVLRGEVLEGVEAVWEPIVTPEEFDAVRAILRDPRRRTNAGGNANAGRKPKHLLAGLIDCGTCGASLRSNTMLDSRRKNAERVYLYRCAMSSQHSDGHAHASIGAKGIEPHVPALVFEALKDRVRRGIDAAEAPPEVKALLTERTALAAERTRVTEVAMMPDADHALTGKRLRQIAERLEVINAEIDAANRDRARSGAIAAATAYLRRFEEVWATLANDEPDELLQRRLRTLDEPERQFLEHWESLALEERRALTRATLHITANSMSAVREGARRVKVEFTHNRKATS